MKQALIKHLSAPLTVSSAIFLLSCGALAFALVMQYMFNLKPCDLCIIQRVPFVITALLGFGGMIAAINPDHMKISALCSFLSGLTFLAGGAAGFYHHGVEQKWWNSFLQGCRVELPEDPNDFLSFIQNNQAVACDLIPWQFLGLSMAAWNAVLSPLLGVVCIIAAILLARRANNFL